MKYILGMAATCALCVGSASAQWVEVGDAPDGVPGRQDTFGVGAMTSISGVLDRPAGDHVDTYSIRITDVASFIAATSDAFGGSAVNQTGGNEDTRLWLWDMNGNLVLANDDVGTGTNTLGSLISDPSTFAGLSGEVVAPTAANIALMPGKYLLSISEFSNDPEDANATDLADLSSDFDALHGANPNAGAFDHWENASDGDIISYRIALRGVEFCEVPAPGTAALIAAPALLGLRRRRA